MFLRFMLVLNWARDWLGDAASHHYFMTGLQLMTIVPFLSNVGRIDFVPHYSMQNTDKLKATNWSPWKHICRISSEADLKCLH